jgi:hypothetical protein
VRVAVLATFSLLSALDPEATVLTELSAIFIQHSLNVPLLFRHNCVGFVGLFEELPNASPQQLNLQDKNK